MVHRPRHTPRAALGEFGNCWSVVAGDFGELNGELLEAIFLPLALCIYITMIYIYIHVYNII
jgi:hypothetical protein